MVNRPHFLRPALTLGWLLSFAVAGCGGGQPAESTGDTGPDVTPPRIIATFPADGQTSIPPGTDIAITFSETLDARRLDLQEVNLGLRQAFNGALVNVEYINITLAWEARSNTLFINVPLAADTHYEVWLNDGWADLAGNRLDTGSPDRLYTWRFTTGDTYDDQKPVWNPNKKVRAVADRYDTITVCWWDDDPAQAFQPFDGCDLPEFPDGNSPPPAAVDLPANQSNGLVYTVQYRRTVDAELKSFPSKIGAQRLTLPGLTASSTYEIQLRVSDLAANQADEIITIEPVPTPPAGRLYVANHVATSLSVLPDVAQAQGDRAAAVVTANETQLYAPTGIAVDPVGGYVYVADPSLNMISAYKLNQQVDVNGQFVPVAFGEYGKYGIGHNLEPEWTIQGTLASTDITGLCGPAGLRLERHEDINKTYIYATNSRVFATGYSPGVCVPDNIVVFDVTQPPQTSNQPPLAVVRNANYFRTPLAFALDETNGLAYVANREDRQVADNAGGTVSVFSYTRDPVKRTLNLSPAPVRNFWGSEGGACTVVAAPVRDRICGPSAAAYDSVTDSLIVINREKSNVLVFTDVVDAVGTQTPVVVEGPDTGLDGARPTNIFLDSAANRVYITTDLGQSLLIFDKGALIRGDNAGNVVPLRVIKGSRTMLGQPAKPLAAGQASPQSHGPFAVAVVPIDGSDKAFVATPGVFDTDPTRPIPSISVFDVSLERDSSVRNTPPDRVLMNPMAGITGVALDPLNQRLYVASFHANMILVYDRANELVNGLKAPDRIIAGPATMLDHPVALLFRRDSVEQGALYVVNQSSHSVAVFQEGDTPATLLEGDVAPSRYIGPPEGTDPFFESPLAQANLSEMVFPTGLAIDPDPDHDILYVSNRDAETFQDLVGRRIVAFANASTLGAYDPVLGVGPNNHFKPTWKVQGDAPPFRPCTVNCLPFTDKTTLKRPAGLALIPDPNPGDAVADDRLVVANRGNGTVLIFRGISALVDAAQTNPPDDNLAPTWTIANPSGAQPFGLAYGAATQDLYVSDSASTRVLAFNLGSLDVGTPLPSLQPRVIQGPSSGLLTPHGLALDPQVP